MSNQVSRWKEKWKEKGDEAKPRWIDPDVWPGLVSFWRDPKSKLKSINSRNARYHDPDGLGIYKYRSGQTSYKARARKRCEMTGESTPDFLLLLDETHRKPDGSFIDRKSEEIYKEVSSKIQEEESLLCLGDTTESTGSGGLSVQAKNKIYAHVAPKKKGGIYGASSLQQEASSAYAGPVLPQDDPVVLSQKLAVAEALIANQAEKITNFDAYFDYLAEKDPEFAALFRSRSSTITEPVSSNQRPEVPNATNAGIGLVAVELEVDEEEKTSLLDIWKMLEKLTGTITVLESKFPTLINQKVSALDEELSKRLATLETNLKGSHPADVPIDNTTSNNNEYDEAHNKELSWMVEEKPSSEDGLSGQRVVKKVVYSMKNKKKKEGEI
ncbi:putative transposase Ptta/En/Spm plant [Arabidopsis thaliana x Arabidopsis arenosa]|uniref:Putative transposase Ptta/En/Spm plant n=1 Tax=Arabidopsis thaliana x Arabidopsis arenosa TaxID=1240361 RepID=A0A8T2GMT0_9BRAS|nr:putative transposase Ptta/En/Spm plant [Arabidopsis thaliana x Arabidopsis arenosa]